MAKGLLLAQEGFDHAIEFVWGKIVDYELATLPMGVEGHLGSKTFLQSVFQVRPLSGAGGTPDRLFPDDSLFD